MRTKKRDKLRKPEQRLLPLMGLAFCMAVIAILFSPQISGGLFRESFSGIQQGMVAERDIIADSRLEYINREKTEELKAAAGRSVPPVYTVQDTGLFEALSHFDRFASMLLSSPSDKSSLSERLESELPRLFEKETRERIASQTDSLVELLPLVEEMIRLVMGQGFFSEKPESSSGALSLIRWNGGERIQERIALEEVLSPDSAAELVRDRLQAAGLSEDDQELVLIITAAFITPNTEFDPARTKRQRDRAVGEVDPVHEQLKAGEKILRKGYIVTGKDMDKIEALKAQQSGIQYGKTLGALLYFLLLFLLAYTLMIRQEHPSWRRYQYLVLSLVMWLFFFLSGTLAFFFAGESTILKAFFLPTALIAMLASSLINERTAFILVLISAFSVVPFVPVAKMDLMFVIVSGLIAIRITKSAERRIDLVRGGAVISAVHLFMVILVGFLQKYPLSWYPAAAGVSIANAAVCVTLGISILPVLEHLLNIPTVFRLMELSELSTPIFKKMQMTAPGTYNHSYLVGSLAEAACRSIGANHLLARVGAYYHDIGKIEQPSYFIENQAGDNKHNELKPSLSVAVIKSHVKLGVEKAKELKLPSEVVDIVGQHHGNGLIEYFYMEAQKSETNGSKVNPEEFSYNGTPPITREGAVVMLADTIEASTRTLKKPTVAKLEKFIWTRIMEKVNNRQLMNCDLTFKDLEKIKQSFVQILAGTFHSRIEYPKMEDSKK